MRLYNTLTRSVEDFQPQNPKHVKFYSCGPTVYDYPHIGNWYAFIRWDIVARILRTEGYDVEWVMNITDVGHLISDADEGEDKLEKGARREGKSAQAIAQVYTEYFMSGLKRLNVFTPSHLPRATDHIREQIKLIETLIDKGYTYRIDDGVYFDTAKLKDYGRLARLDTNYLLAAARITANLQKRNSADFALWKFSPADKNRDMEWESPWGKGFPGWHIECSAMAMKYLGETLDIHAGGIDHIPVHHTNEIAQSQAATGKPFAKYWLHSNFILVQGSKMSKSMGNYYTLEDIESKGYDLMAFRLLVLESHYRSEAQFSWETLQAAQNRLQSLQAMADQQWQVQDQGLVDISELTTARRYITEALTNDFNAPEAMAALSRLEGSIDNGGINATCQEAYSEFLIWLDAVLGLGLSKRPDITAAQKMLLRERSIARDAKDWQMSDILRDKLAAQGITVRDTAQGQLWGRANANIHTQASDSKAN